MARFTSLLVVAALATTAAACGSDHTPSAAARKAFVEARAQALCAVSAKAFSSEHDLEQAYLTSTHANISPEDEKALKSQLDTDETLRAAITTRYASQCG